jgi:hypothetical protein
MQSVEIRSCNGAITDEIMAYICNAKKVMINIQKLTDVGLANLMKGRTQPLIKVKLYIGQYTEDGIICLITPNLRKLRVRFNIYPTATPLAQQGPSVSKLVPLIGHLKTFKCSGATLGNDDLIYLKDVKKLDINGSKLTNDGFRHISRIRYLTLRDAPMVTSEGISALKGLLYLSLSNCTGIVSSQLPMIPSLHIFP